MLHKTLICLLVLISSLCKAQVIQQNKKPLLPADTIKDYSALLTELEQQASERNNDSLGTLITTIPFQVKTSDRVNYENGLIPYIELENPTKSIKDLVDGDKVVIKEDTVILLIVYPLTQEFKTPINSKHGFTKRELLAEISKVYHRIFTEEETTATVKTIPINQRTTYYNRNQTNGKYGIWGHDLADLVLTEVLVYKAPDGRLIACLNIES